MRILALLPLLTLASGCHNPCQKLCDDMYDYAQDCGFQPTDEQLDECYREQASSEASRDKRAECRMNASDLRDEWDCEDLVRYFDDDPGDTSVDRAWPEDTW